ncbi:diacylglycerol kinase [Pokkaliibacter sp. CJK22405]|uniref:diacylglycerol kinase n=1 Tax=Pokkaliibacter sp. CJK22405 TaxID=3384615 RepID=UPI0039848FC1
MKQQAPGLTRLWHASRYSWQGLRAAWQNEAAVRQEILALLVLVPTACFLPVTGVERALMIASLGLVLIVELLNSAIEATIDRIGHEHHPLSGMAKDIGSAAVTVALLVAAGVWLCILV